MKHQVHTSDLLTRLMNEAPKDTVDLDWLLGHLQKRAFGLLLLAWRSPFSSRASASSQA